MKEEYRTYFRWAVTVISTFTACIVIFFFLFRLESVSGFFGKAMGAIQSIIYGLVIAYVLGPIATFWQNLIERKLLLKMKPEEESRKKKIHSIAKGVSVAIAMTIGLLVITTVISMIVPKVAESIMNVVASSSGFMVTIENWVNNLMERYPELMNAGGEVYANGIKYLENWVTTDLLAQVNALFAGFTTYVINFFSSMLNWILGLIIAVYALVGREDFVGQAKKIAYALMRPEAANTVITIARKSNQIFGGFISGKLIDSMIIGVICFVGLSVLGTPYTLLVSVIVGVTNVIPFFGPYVGAVPCTILILLVNPIQALYFIFFILVLQQVDGNIIGPKILGDSTGLSAFWVIFSILLFGGLFGFVGMLIGVPTFAVIYYLIKLGVEYLLRKKKLPTETETYTGLDRVEVGSGKILFLKEKPKEDKQEEKKQGIASKGSGKEGMGKKDRK